MGLLPTATTTAEPEWLPFAIRSGSAAPADEREGHLAELRRLTEGWTVDRIAFSPDAREIAVVAVTPGSSTPALFLVPLGSGAPRRASRDGERVVGLTASASSPWRVVYAVDEPEGTVLVELGTNGEPRPLATGDVKPRAAALSPDGAALYVVGETGNDRGVFSTSEGKSRLLVADKGAQPFLAVSADKSYLAWPSEEGGKRRIVVASVEGRGVRSVVTGGGAAPAFLAGTQHLLFASDADVARKEIYAIDLTSAEARPQRVTFSQGEHPTATADGALVAFASSRGGGGRDLYVARWVDGR